MSVLYPEMVQLVAILSRKMVAAQPENAGRSGFSDLTLRQVVYLEEIERLDNPTPTELARALQVSKPSASIAVEKLVENGYVRKVASDEDRRSFHLHLTEKARQISRAHQRVHEEIAGLLLENLSIVEQEQLQILLAKIVRSIE